MSGVPGPSDAAMPPGLATPQVFSTQAPFSESELIRQLNQWRQTVESQFMDASGQFGVDRARITKLEAELREMEERMDSVKATAEANLEGVVRRGANTLQATIDSFNTRIGQDRYAMAAQQETNMEMLRQVVEEARQKFLEIEAEQRAEVERSRATDTELKAEFNALFQSTKEKFESMDAFLDLLPSYILRVTATGAPGGTPVAATSIDPLSGLADPWSSFRAPGAPTGAPSPPEAPLGAGGAAPPQ